MMFGGGGVVAWRRLTQHVPLAKDVAVQETISPLVMPRERIVYGKIRYRSDETQAVQKADHLVSDKRFSWT